jgi:predicted transcriptional regulator of viral defense system
MYANLIKSGLWSTYMISMNKLNDELIKHGGIMKTSELKAVGLNSRQILRLVEENTISKIKTGFYEIAGMSIPDEVLIAKLFPTAVVYLESALMYYGYTDRIPAAWQIAVDKNISKPQLKISYPPIMPFFLDNKYIETGLDLFEVNGVKIRIYDKERTICDVLRYANKLDREVFNSAIQRYVKDKDRNIKRLMEYAKKMRVTQKVKTYVGVWL